MYSNSPAKDMFDQQMITLAGQGGETPYNGEWKSTEIIFYMDFYMENRNVGILVYDFGKRQDHTPATQYSDYDSAADALKQIIAEFPGRLDEEKVLDTLKTYFTGLKESVASSGSIVSDGDKCNHCGGYNFDDYRFLYFPTVPGTPLDKASLELTWDYGCYNSDTVEGIFEDVAPEIITMLEEILDYAEPENIKEIQHALDTVRSHKTF